MRTQILHTPPEVQPITATGAISAAHDARPLRLAAALLPPQRVFSGNRRFLRAVRAAEMALWNATGGDYLRSPSAN